MTVYCESCESPESAKRDCSPSSPYCSVDINDRVCKRFRSTKGASKARRDHINGEIRNMRALLPISREDQERLSYLHSMSVICAFVRKSVLYQALQEDCQAGSSIPYDDFIHALPGFIVAMTKEGKLVYVSENVAEYLGFSMVDVLQGDSFYDMVESSDVDTVKFNLGSDSVSSTDKAFVCRMHTSKAFRVQHGSCCSMLLRGRFQAGPQSSLFVALCTPTVNRLKDGGSPGFAAPFQTLHKPDMSFAQVPDGVLFHLGYSAEEMIGRSWYSLLHPDDLSLSVCGHKSLMQENEDTQVEMVLRMQCKDLSWVWLYVWAAKESGKREVSCTNYVISETEAIFLKQKIYSVPLRASPQSFCSPPIPETPWGQGECPTRSPKRQREASGRCEEPRRKTRRVSESSPHNVVCDRQGGDTGSSAVTLGDGSAFYSTPPYSPASSHSSALQEDRSSDFLLDVYGCAEGPLSPSGSSSPYYPGPGLPGHFSPSPPLRGFSDQAFNLSPFGLVSDHSPDPSCPLPSCTFPGCQTDVHLVPSYQPVLEVCESQSDCVLHPEDFSLLPAPQSQGGAGAPQVPQSSASPLPAGLPTPDPSPTAESHFRYSEREQAEISILARQISSLASSFDAYRARFPGPRPARPETRHADPGWPRAPTRPPRPELVLDEGVVDSIMKQLDAVAETEELPRGWGQTQAQALSLAALMHSLPLGQFSSADSALDPCVVRPGCHDENAELHQLNQYLHSSLQQDGLVEESMY